MGKTSNLFRASVREEMPLWERGLTIAKSGAFNLRNGGIVYEDIRLYTHLMFAINSKGEQRKTTLEEWFEILNLKPLPNFPEVAQKLREEFEANVPVQPLTGEYVSGFCQGDGSFSLNNAQRFCPSFSITDKDRYILCLIRDFLKLPKKVIFDIDPKTSQNNKICYRLQVDRFQVCIEKLIPVFDEFPLVYYYKERICGVKL